MDSDSDTIPVPSPDEPPPIDYDVEQRRRQMNNAAITLMAVLLGVGVFTYLGPIFKPLLVAVFLFFILKPIADWFGRRGLREWIAWMVLFGLTVVLGIVITQVIYSEAMEFQQNIPEYRESGLQFLSRVTGWSTVRLEQISFAEMFEFSTGEIISYSVKFAAGFLELFLMVFFYLMFVIMDARDVPGRIRRAFDGDTAEHLLHVGESIIDGFTSYMRVKTLVGLGMGATAGVIVWAFDLPHGWLWAFLTFLLNYITYIGSLLILVPPILISFAVLEPAGAIVATILLCLNRVFWIDYVEIHHSGRQLNINSCLILLSLAYWGWFWGVVGLILAVPMLTCVKIVLSNFEATKRWAILMSED